MRYLSNRIPLAYWSSGILLLLGLSELVLSFNALYENDILIKKAAQIIEKKLWKIGLNNKKIEHIFLGFLGLWKVMSASWNGMKYQYGYILKKLQQGR